MRDNDLAAAQIAAPAIPQPHKQHILALDGLRGIAAIAVFIYHRRWWVSDDAVFIEHAYLAVDFFFMLSGLVVALAYEQRLRDGRMRTRDFAALRAIRLYPLIILGAVFGAGFMIFKALLGHDIHAIWRVVAAFPLAAAVLPIPPQLFDQPFALNEPSWSLFFELAANLLFAVMAPVLSRRLLGIAIVVLAASLIAASFDGDGLKAGYLWPTLYVGAIRVGFSFLIGVALSRWLVSGRLPRLPIPFWALAVLLIACFVPTLFAPAWNAAYDLAMVMVAFPAIIIMGCGCRSAGAWTGIMRISGEISYPVYIIHCSLLWWIEAVMWRLGFSNRMMLATAILIVLPIAWLLGRWYDEPVRNFLRRRFARTRPKDEDQRAVIDNSGWARSTSRPSSRP